MRYGCNYLILKKIKSLTEALKSFIVIDWNGETKEEEKQMTWPNAGGRYLR